VRWLDRMLSPLFRSRRRPLPELEHEVAAAQRDHRRAATAVRHATSDLAEVRRVELLVRR
jgi:hypothetical protein